MTIEEKLDCIIAGETGGYLIFTPAEAQTLKDALTGGIFSGQDRDRAALRDSLDRMDD